MLVTREGSHAAETSSAAPKPCTAAVRHTTGHICRGNFKNALQDTNEVEVTVTGRKSGRESSRPAWFVQEADQVLLLPVGGSDSNWYKSVLKTPRATG